MHASLLACKSARLLASKQAGQPAIRLARQLAFRLACRLAGRTASKLSCCHACCLAGLQSHISKILSQILRHVLHCRCGTHRKIRGSPQKCWAWQAKAKGAAERAKLAVDSVHSATINPLAELREDVCRHYQLTLPSALRTMGHAEDQPATICFRGQELL
jgi:hypothetical protein